MRRSLTLALVGLLLFAGCASRDKDKKLGDREYKKTETGKAEADKRGEEVGGAPPEAEPGKQVPKKIRYTANIAVVVKELTAAEQSLMQLLEKEKGYVAKSDITGTTGERRRGEWTLRVPVERFHPFRDAVVKLGEPVRNSLDSEDVTEEFYDLQARIKNMQAEEA